MWADYLLEPSLFIPSSHSLMCLSAASVFCPSPHFCCCHICFDHQPYHNPPQKIYVWSSQSCIALQKIFIKIIRHDSSCFLCLSHLCFAWELKLVSISFSDCFLFAFLIDLHPTHFWIAKVTSDVKASKKNLQQIWIEFVSHSAVFALWTRFRRKYYM